MALDPVTAILDIGSKVIDKIWPDPVQRDKAKLELLKLQQEGAFKQLEMLAEADKAQIAVNVEEAKSANVFVSGWRPAIGWICAAACAWNWIGISIVQAGSALGIYTMSIPLSTASLTDMLPILLGMLGLGSLRTVEKIQGVASK